jgi:hypothetical protein
LRKIEVICQEKEVVGTLAVNDVLQVLLFKFNKINKFAQFHRFSMRPRKDLHRRRTQMWLLDRMVVENMLRMKQWAWTTDIMNIDGLMNDEQFGFFVWMLILSFRFSLRQVFSHMDSSFFFNNIQHKAKVPIKSKQIPLIKAILRRFCNCIYRLKT